MVDFPHVGAYGKLFSAIIVLEVDQTLFQYSIVTIQAVQVSDIVI